LLWEETEYLMALGTRVLHDLEEPVVYIVKADYDAAKMKKASVSKKSRTKKLKKKKDPFCNCLRLCLNDFQGIVYSRPEMSPQRSHHSLYGVGAECRCMNFNGRT